MSAIPLADPLTISRALRHGRTALCIAYRGARRHVYGLVAMAILAGLTPVAAAWLLKLVLDWLSDRRPGAALVWVALGLALLGVAVAVLPRVTSYAEAELNRHVKIQSLDTIFHSVHRRLRGLARFEDPRFHDRLRLAASAGATAPSQVVRNALGLGQGTLSLAGFLVTMMIINPWLALAVAAAAIPAARAEILLSRRRVGALWRIENAERRRFFYWSLLTSPQQAKEIRLFGLGAFFQRRMLSEVQKVNNTERVLDRRELVVQAFLALVGAAIAGVGLVWAIQAAQRGHLSLGDVSVFVAAVAGVQGGMSDLISRFAQMHQSLLVLDHYQAVITVKNDIKVPGRVQEPPPLRSAIELHDVWFRYGHDRPWVLSGINLTIVAGSSTALVGVNGSGKSTIVKLLCRFYDPTRGQITWDGIDLREIDPDLLRRRVAAAFQDYVVYDLSASENIGVGDLAVLDDHDRIRIAAKRAGIHEVLTALPAGYETPITRLYMANADRDDPDTGVLLSGGQGQRLALARTFLRDDGDLLILDEPSSGLDAAAEARIHQQLRDHRKGRTSLLISHRLNTVRDADHIAVLADGRVAERGDHSALIAANGVYAELFALQARGYADSVGATS